MNGTMMEALMRKAPKLLFDKIESGDYNGKKGKLVDDAAYKLIKNIVFATTNETVGHLKDGLKKFINEDSKKDIKIGGTK